MPKRHALWVALALSLFAHSGFVLGLSVFHDRLKKFKPKQPLAFEVIKTPEPVVENKVGRAPEPDEPAPQVKSVARNRPVVTDAPPPTESPKDDKPPPAAETPVDLTGVTLTNKDNSGDFAAQQGSGASSDKPIGPSGVNTGRTKPGVAGGEVGGKGVSDVVVPVGSLSRAPQIPALDDALERNYPPEARAQGIEGTAKVRAKITATGSITDVRIITDPGHGFGVACKKTLQSATASAPLDQRGQPVATEITYTCTFEVRF